jgi:hypothetical protein
MRDDPITMAETVAGRSSNQSKKPPAKKQKTGAVYRQVQAKPSTQAQLNQPRQRQNVTVNS